ncbi:MAG: NAD(P)/FAD-dependent oxidoreductase [Clostridia bacterium]|nr:NAD(P)/FAD-dependent oxidoreductase [Clostridia bacterium]
MRFDSIIIGGGPAGITAAVYIARAGFSCAVIDDGRSSLLKTDKIENYYGFDTVSGKELFEKGIAQAERLGVKVQKAQVLSVDFEDMFAVLTSEEKLYAKTVVIATGSGIKGKKIKGEEEFEGRGVSRCAVCDGFFFKGKNVAVIGDGEFALHEADVLLGVCGSVTLLSNGKDITSDKFKVITDKISHIIGENTVSGVVLENGEKIPFDGVFIANGVPSAADFALRTGISENRGVIVTDENMKTSVPGIFAAGDCTIAPKQIATAVYSGMKCAFSVIEYLRGR